MSEFLVVQSDDSSTGRGVRGRTLVTFLRLFAGRRNVKVVKPSDLDRSRFHQTNCLFIGIPSRLKADQISRVNAKQIVLFDYHDTPESHWAYSDHRFLQSLTDRYFKPCVESNWNPTIKWGCLPLRRRFELNLKLRQRSFRERYSSSVVPEKAFDVGFLGFPTSLILNDQTKSSRYPQRIQWMSELVRETDYSWWGGLCPNPKWRSELEQRHGNLSDLCSRESRLSFGRYFDALSSCRVILTPAGNARWTYRHYEAIYNRSVLISTDLSQSRFLIPLPQDCLINVKDFEAISPAVRDGLNLFQENPERVLLAEREMEKYFRYGDYSRKCPLSWDRFVAQLDVV
ncbi:hypothetical protein OAL43_02505 [bacterium]|nr:hypothetical protein [Rubripirellula sp.]MDB4338662.1 hypothetical protein [Rubripirellula sp.]MDC0279055.1 hypothetical protein [bacterium]